MNRINFEGVGPENGSNAQERGRPAVLRETARHFKGLVHNPMMDGTERGIRADRFGPG